MGDNFILTKNVDWSFLNQGFAIPVAMQEILSLYLSDGRLRHGEKRKIVLVFNDESHIATLASVDFNQNKYPEHKDIWRILYTPNGTFAKTARAIFNKTFNILLELRKQKQDNCLIKLHPNERESIALYTTDIKDTFFVEPFFNEEINITSEERNESFIENLLNIQEITDTEATIIEKYHLSKIRKLNRKIGEYLKKVYDFRCQICGEYVGNIYGAKIAECHHINYFVSSLNNEISNLLIVCPNHHRIIHAKNPEFDFGEKIYRYPNGFEERLKLNIHL